MRPSARVVCSALVAACLLWPATAASGGSAGPTTCRLSVGSNEAQADGWSFMSTQSMSADGRFVVFTSFSTNLVRGGTSLGPRGTEAIGHVYLRDRLRNVTELLSVGPRGQEGDDNSGNASISRDGQFVAFTSAARNLVAGDSNRQIDVFVRDLRAGVTRLVSLSSRGTQGTGASYGASHPVVSDGGRYVAFESEAADLVSGDTNGVADVFVRDVVAGRTWRASVSSAGQQVGAWSRNPSISADGRRVAFATDSSDLVPGDTNAASDVFVWDRSTKVTERVSLSTQGDQATGSPRADSAAPALSADGRFVGFVSTASNLVPLDTNGAHDTFLRDLATGVTQRVSVSTAGTQADGAGGNGFSPSVSSDGRFVAFAAGAANLVPHDTDGDTDVFVRDTHRGTTTLVSRSRTGEQVAGNNYAFAISDDGQQVAFLSEAADLVPRDTNGGWDVFARDRTGRYCR